MQVGAGYLVQPNFLAKYAAERGEFLFSDEFWNCYEISVKQACYDRTYLYGIIVATNRNRKDKAILAHRTKQDGIAAWIDLLKAYDHGGSVNLKVWKLETAIRVPHKTNTAAGLDEHLDLLEANMTHLDALSDMPLTDERKKWQLADNLKHIPTIASIVATVPHRHNITFDEAVMDIRNAIQVLDVGALNNERSKLLRTTAHHAKPCDDDDPMLDVTDTVALINKITKETDAIQALRLCHNQVFGLTCGLRMKFGTNWSLLCEKGSLKSSMKWCWSTEKSTEARPALPHTQHLLPTRHPEMLHCHHNVPP